MVSDRVEHVGKGGRIDGQDVAVATQVVEGGFDGGDVDGAYRAEVLGHDRGREPRSRRAPSSRW